MIEERIKEAIWKRYGGSSDTKFLQEKDVNGERIGQRVSFKDNEAIISLYGDLSTGQIARIVKSVQHELLTYFHVRSIRFAVLSSTTNDVLTGTLQRYFL